MKPHTKPSIGIWGFGRVGKSAIEFLSPKASIIRVFDDRLLKADELSWLANHGATLCTLNELLTTCDYILPSPGVNCESYRDQYQGTWLNELDLFYDAWKKPIIAITGSVGKTTVTHLITQLLQTAGTRAIAAGNIGLPMLEIIEQRNRFDVVVLEVSSFQLEYCLHFAPDLAIWTNFFPNHLDRHTTLDKYFDAKYAMIRNQHAGQKSLVPYELQPRILERNPRSEICTFESDNAASTYTISNGIIAKNCDASMISLIDARTPSSSIYAVNWLIAYSALDMLDMSPVTLTTISSLEHRLEKVATIEGITFYNDSKSTVPLSTSAALENIHASRIMLFLGGLSKGIDRIPFIQSLRGKALYIVCFGKEAEILHAACQASNIPSIAYQTLDDAFAHCVTQLQPGDCVLFSPAGSSFDLFKNYEERGNYFKNAVLRYQSLVESHSN